MFLYFAHVDERAGLHATEVSPESFRKQFGIKSNMGSLQAAPVFVQVSSQ